MKGREKERKKEETKIIVFYGMKYDHGRADDERVNYS